MVQEVKAHPELNSSPDINTIKEQKLKEILDPKALSVLYVIDMQEEFVSDEGKSAKNWGQNIAPMQAIMPRIEAVTQMFRALGKPIVRTINYENVDERTTAGKDRALFMEGVVNPEDEEFEVACLRGTPGAELTMKPQEGDIVIEKNRSSAYTPQFEQLLHEMREEAKRKAEKEGKKVDKPFKITVYFTGVKTQRCVEATVRDVYDKAENVHVVVLEDCVASDDVEQHESSLKEMRHFYPPVITSARLAEAWKDALVAPQAQAAD